MGTLKDWYYSRIKYPLNKHQLVITRQRWVYVFGNKFNKTCKIGIAERVYERKQQLQATCGHELKLILAIELSPGMDESAKLIEEQMHEYFKAKRIMGEWFNLSPKDLFMIRDLFFRIGGEEVIDYIRITLRNDESCAKQRRFTKAI